MLQEFACCYFYLAEIVEGTSSAASSAVPEGRAYRMWNSIAACLEKATSLKSDSRPYPLLGQALVGHTCGVGAAAIYCEHLHFGRGIKVGEGNAEVKSLPGIIPDFFHDILAYIIPGSTALILLGCNLYIVGLPIFFETFDKSGWAALGGLSLSGVAAYVIGRFFEQLGILTMNRTWLPCFFCRERPSPKWSLIFGQEESAKSKYTDAFKYRT